MGSILLKVRLEDLSIKFLMMVKYMSSLIIDLQKDIFENKDILSILHKAYSISKELELHDFSNWINSEINGYSNVKNIPDYRFIECEFLYDTEYRREIKLTNKSIIKNILNNIPKECHKEFIKSAVKIPLPEIIHICEKKPDTITFHINSACEKKIKNNIPNATKTYKKCQLYQFESIIDYVKHELIEWTSELKKQNILGENYVFSDDEIDSAKKNIVFNIIASNSQIQIGNNNVQFSLMVRNINYNLNEIRNILNEYPVDGEIYTEINDNIEIIENQINNENSDLDLVKKSANIIKKIAEGISIDIVAQIIFNNINNILNYIMILI